MNGMLIINVRYTIEGSQWQYFTQEFIAAFRHPVFSGLPRIHEHAKVNSHY